MSGCIPGQQDTYVCDLLLLDPLTILVVRRAVCPGLLPAVVSLEKLETSILCYSFVYTHHE